ncbi:hypothetical protein [Actinophytocola sp.]|uniref:hypothetical protein n=1 Tax=Actinophytocola sp. TaxID=1872138 RepID=UPI0025B82B5B|nr:hypothetical protein [Actinophytocola sp.]
MVLFDLPRELEPDPEYVDEIAVDLACRGERVRLTRPEFVEAVRRLTRGGESTRQVAERLRVEAWVIERVRRALRQARAAASATDEVA